MPRRPREPCLCGADDCPRCFPRSRLVEDGDDAYDLQVAREVNAPEPQRRTPYCQEDE